MYDCPFSLVTYLCLSGNHGNQIQWKQGQMSLKWMKIAFWKKLLKFCSFEMSMVVETRQDPRMELYRNTPWNYRVYYKGWRGNTPSNYPFVTPFSYGRNGPNDKTIVMFGPMASTSNTFDESQPKYTWWHGLGLGFTWVLPQGHDKVISRSQEGQISSK